MDVKVGVLHTPREIIIDSAESTEDVEKQVAEALKSDGKVLSLTDRRGRRVLIPSDRIAYVEIAEADNRRVGFATAE
ncbi:uncharacterized protein DUF3107 [Antricoccus suffuscus]|uniref:Uncharacterized protein DUF3107 n=1 Tax=Antricoccus suffuscus TaxID=1629062 RepID=A0A2T0ZQC3_9ACTN|nr:DUF3107 domain-containing protein [Antricoccus suffuscus]PRZ38559.1 uncharacterized protein DUF3107 [Antricoccus suffuscus]